MITGALALLSGCGSSPDSKSDRSAAAANSLTSCPEKVGSKATIFPVANYLNEPVEMRGYNVDCNDWSGTSTPDRVFDNVVLQPGEKREFDLEAYADNAIFSLEFSSMKTGSIGKIRLLVSPGEGTYVVFAPNPRDVTRIEGWRLKKLQPSDADPVPLDRLGVKGGFGITYYDGYIQAVSSD